MVSPPGVSLAIAETVTAINPAFSLPGIAFILLAAVVLLRLLDEHDGGGGT